MTVTELLDAAPGPGELGSRRGWLRDLERSLAADGSAWLGLAREGGLTKGRAWLLLAWIEDAASWLVRDRRPALVEGAAFAFALLETSPLDRRDEMLVADLVHRACTLAHLDFATLAATGCARGEELGAECASWLLGRPARTPSTHEEAGWGRTFEFRRLPPTFDVEELERWAKGE